VIVQTQTLLSIMRIIMRIIIMMRINYCSLKCTGTNAVVLLEKLCTNK